jgi:putative transposase
LHQSLEKGVTADPGVSCSLINLYNSDGDANIELRQIKYLNNIVEQDHRAVKSIIRSMVGLNRFG